MDQFNITDHCESQYNNPDVPSCYFDPDFDAAGPFTQAQTSIFIPVHDDAGKKLFAEAFVWASHHAASWGPDQERVDLLWHPNAATHGGEGAYELLDHSIYAVSKTESGGSPVMRNCIFYGAGGC